MKSLVSRLVWLGFFSSSVTAFAQPNFTYKLPAFPVEAHECYDQAQTIAETLSGLADITVSSKVCQPSAIAGFDIEITYSAHTRLRVVSTASPRLSIDPVAGYRSLQACEEALPREVDLFLDATGLEVLTSYCQATQPTRGEFVARIEGVGEPLLSPQISGYYSFVAPLVQERREQLGEQYGVFSELGYPVRYLLWRPTLGYGRVSLAYYAAQRLNMQEDVISQLRNAEDCLTQLPRVASFSDGFEKPVLQLFCGRGSPRVGAELAMVWLSNTVPGSINALENYASFDACWQQLESLEQSYGERTGLEIFGSLCNYQPDEKTYRPVFFY